MANTHTLISSVTVGSGGSSTISFTSIPATYTDLVLKISSRSSVSNVNDYPIIEFNGSVASYSLRGLQGNGAAVQSYTDTSIYGIGSGNNQTANTFGNSEFYIPNYAGSAYKSVSVDGVNEDNATNAVAALIAGLWVDTPAIISIALKPYHASQTFVQYSSFYLYGISNA